MSRDAELLALLRGLELRLQQPEQRRDPAVLAALLHPEFAEIGRSGRAYERAQMLELLLSADSGIAPDEAIVAEAFTLSELAEGVALLRYRSARRGADARLQRHTQRSSLWLLTPQGWQLRFHQGTATEAWD